MQENAFLKWNKNVSLFNGWLHKFRHLVDHFVI